MGTTRIDDLPDRRLIQAVSEARQVAKERKGSPQRVSGANLAFITSSSASAYDWSGRLDGPVGTPSYGQARFIITLSSARATVPMIDVSATVFYSTDGVTFTVYPYERGLSDTYTATTPEIWRTLTVLPGIENGPGEVKYALQLFGQIDTRAAFKIQVAGIDEVTIAVTRTA